MLQVFVGALLGIAISACLYCIYMQSRVGACCFGFASAALLYALITCLIPLALVQLEKEIR